ncbi:hypothetical protein O1M54_02445 [Streptomyces diastatochromogenes]|nr:hypothetical protein [Streptomyces diastatochromogenes]
MALPEVDWQATLMAGHHTLWGRSGCWACRTHRRAGGGRVGQRAGDRVAGRMLLVSAALDPGADTPTASVPPIDPALTGFTTEPPGAPRLYYATVSWLGSLMNDLARIAHGSRE